MLPVIKVKRRTSGKDVSRNRYNSFLVNSVIWKFEGMIENNNYWKELGPLIFGM